MTKVMTAFIVRETAKHIYVAPRAAYISITSMLRGQAEIPESKYLKIEKDLIIARKVAKPAIRRQSFLTAREIGKKHVDTVVGEKLTLA